jgi:hypothetical protein
MRKAAMVVQAVEGRMVKLVGEEEMAGTRPGIGMVRMGRMVLEVASKL